MNFFYGALIAFSMYSKIPLPRIEWSKERMRYAMGWFPAVGLVCGGGMWIWLRLAAWWKVHPVTVGCAGAVIPVLLTGGIHLDGFLDTLDALSSYAERERKLEILKDPHIGAFAPIGLGLYLLLYTGVLIQLYADARETKQWAAVAAYCMAFPLERAFSGLSVIVFPCAKNSGLAKTFSDSAQKRIVTAILLLWMLILSCGLIKLGGYAQFLFLVGGSVSLVFVYYRRVAVREFGGVTGDLAGWFLQIAELTALLVLTAVSHGQVN